MNIKYSEITLEEIEKLYELISPYFYLVCDGDNLTIKAMEE